MSEKSLKTRQKFINKFNSKLEDLTDDLDLLLSVDRKIFRKIGQRGGADAAPSADVGLKELQVAALTKKLQLDKQNKDLESALKKAQDLQSKIGNIKDALLGIKADIDSMNIQSKATAIAALNPPDVATHDKVVLFSLENLLVWNDNSEIAKTEGEGADAKPKHNITKESYLELLSGLLTTLYGNEGGKNTVNSENLAATIASLKADAHTADSPLSEDAWQALKLNVNKTSNAEGTALEDIAPAAARKYFSW